MARITKYRNLDTGDVLPASWTDALQEFVGTLAANLRLTLQAANVVQAVASAGAGQASVGVAGLWRYRTTSATATVSGVTGTKDIYIVASANAFATTPTPDTDNTDYNWYLQVLDAAATPTGNTPLGAPITAYAKVGELRWDGTTTVTLLRQTYGAQDTTLPMSPVASQPGQVPARIIGATAQTANLLEARIGATGTNVFSVGPDGAILSAGAFNADGIVSSDLYVDSPAYRVAGTPLAASHLSNGVTGSGAVVLASSAALLGTPTAPTAATGSADTTIATTALVANKITAALGGGGGSSFASLSLSGSGKTTLVFPDTTTTTGITWGGDTTLYRNAADVLKTDDSLIVAGTLAVTGVATFTAAPVGPTAAVDTNTTQLATTAFVIGQAYAKLASPTFTGVPAAPTAGAGTSTTQLATTAFVTTADNLKANLASPTFTGVPAGPTAAGGTNTTQLATTAFVTAAVTAGASPDATAATKGLIQLAGDLTGTAALPTIKASVGLTGTPTAPSAAVDTSTTQLATTAFVTGQASASSPLMDGAVATGTSLRYSRQDHVHPTDTSRSPLASPTFTGVPAGPTAAVDTNTTQLATTAFVVAQKGTATPIINGTGAAGTSLRYAAQDHVHPTDTSRAPTANPTFTGTATVNAVAIVVDTDTRIPTQGENDALVGTSGAPVTANPYVSMKDPKMLGSRVPGAGKDGSASIAGVQAGILSGCKVIQTPAGANQGYRIGSGQAILFDSTVAGLAVYTDNTNEDDVVTAAHASLPRIDSIYVSSGPQFGVALNTRGWGAVAGTATSGATLDNRLGAAAIPANAVLVADILRPAANNIVTTANIRDRRPWANGAKTRISGNAVAAFTVATSVLQSLAAGTFDVRLETAGMDVSVIFEAVMTNATANTAGNILLLIDGAVVFQQLWNSQTASSPLAFSLDREFALAAGSHVFSWQWNTSAGTLSMYNQASIYPQMRIQEIMPSQNNS